jgi:hypothetical protein
MTKKQRDCIKDKVIKNLIEIDDYILMKLGTDVKGVGSSEYFDGWEKLCETIIRFKESVRVNR